MTEEVDKFARKNEMLDRRPSEEKAWLKYYPEGEYDRVRVIPYGLTLWDFLERELLEHRDINALEYFRKKISRDAFIESVNAWARTFKALGVEEDEVVPVYGPFFPDICAMVCALDAIGAVTYFLKLEMTESALQEETSESKIAVVYDGMWSNVDAVFTDSRFQKILIATPSDAMDRRTQAQLVRSAPIETLKSLVQARKNKSRIPNTSKYMWLDEAQGLSNYYTGNIKVPFVPNRSAFITSSSGTSIGGVVKGTVATNESAIAQLLQGSNVNYPIGGKCLTNLPPTAATSLNALFFSALFHGMTCIIEPRLSEKGFYKQIIENRPQVAIMTGSFWEAFFRAIERDIRMGMEPDLSFFAMPLIGGEGVIPEDLEWFNNLLSRCQSPVPMVSGCGMSEVFSVSSVEKPFMDKCAPKRDRPVISVGIPYPGLEIKIIDTKTRDELGYCEQGELWIRGQTVTKGYYLKPELTAETIDEDGWLHTGDIYEIDEDGSLYIYGRISDCTVLRDGTVHYLWEIAHLIQRDEDIKYCFVNAYPSRVGNDILVAHVVFRDRFQGEKTQVYKRVDSVLRNSLHEDLPIAGYLDHELTFSSSPTTAKKDRKALMKILDGYIKPVGDITLKLSLAKEASTGKYSTNYEEQKAGRS